MKVVFMVLVLAMVASAQTEWAACGLRAPGTNPDVQFVRQGLSRIPGLDEYAVCVTAAKDEALRLEAIRIVVEALHRGIRVYTYSPLQNYVDQLNHQSNWRYILVVCELAGMAATIPISGDLAEIKEKVLKIAVPIGTAGCAIGRHLVISEYEPIAIPRDLVPTMVAAPPGGLAEFYVWAEPGAVR